jgi:hypothetical protein
MRRRLTYANVASTLALVFSMTGGALAAKHYLINSTKQINPKVLRALRGKPGPKGAPGTAGSPGTTGKEGLQGREGPTGQSALAPLPSGGSESGDYGIRDANSGSTGFIGQAVSYPVQLAVPIAESNVIYTVKPPVAHCPGAGQADRGFLCIYSGNRESVVIPPAVYSYEGEKSLGAGKLGFYMEWTVNLNGAYDVGTYTVTAP